MKEIKIKNKKKNNLFHGIITNLKLKMILIIKSQKIIGDIMNQKFKENKE